MERVFQLGRQVLLRVTAPFTFSLVIFAIIIFVKDPCQLSFHGRWLDFDYHGRCEAQKQLPYERADVD